MHEAVDAGAMRAVFGGADVARVAIPIWTTTPWTLPASLAVSLHPSLEYSLVVSGEQGLVVASELVASVCERIGWTDFRVAESWLAMLDIAV